MGGVAEGSDMIAVLCSVAMVKGEVEAFEIQLLERRGARLSGLGMMRDHVCCTSDHIPKVTTRIYRTRFRQALNTPLSSLLYTML